MMMNFILKILFVVLVSGFVIYSFMIALRTRIVSQTVTTKKAPWLVRATYINVVFTIILGLLAILLIVAI